MWYTKTAIVLANLGAINWGLNELGWNAVDELLSFVSWLPMVVYYVIGLSGLYGMYKLFSK
ncbi:MAG: DUF378 domain-containing protein [Nanoarchaeota archaeon]|nr:DUF378 domain-containing protein [Nanoarchaeota archaeon]